MPKTLKSACRSARQKLEAIKNAVEPEHIKRHRLNRAAMESLELFTRQRQELAYQAQNISAAVKMLESARMFVLGSPSSQAERTHQMIKTGESLQGLMGQSMPLSQFIRLVNSDSQSDADIKFILQLLDVMHGSAKRRLEELTNKINKIEQSYRKQIARFS